MKNENEFRTFMDNTVNLNKTRIEKLTSSVTSLSKFLAEDATLSAQIIRFSAQGSWAHKTIIKPPSDKGFDADLLVFVKPQTGWTPADYLAAIRSRLISSAVYKDKTTLRTRCVVVDYAGDFSIDVVPCVVGRVLGLGSLEICNRRDQSFEPTDPEKYTAWLDLQDAVTRAHRLREVTRLIKYLRDIKQTFNCKSILLTTLLGNQVTPLDGVQSSGQFSDLPTSLRSLVGRLDNYLQARPQFHEISNPVLPGEHFVRHWDADKYANFREVIHRYREWIDDAYTEPDEAKSLEKWQRVFGDEFATGQVRKAAEALESVSALPATASQWKDAVDFVKRQGRGVLASVRQTFPWVKPMAWTFAQQYNVVIHSLACRSRNDASSGQPIESGTIVTPGLHLLFEARNAAGGTFGKNDFDVKWQVVNTDEAARRDGGLRGEFYSSDSPSKRWEHTRYRGVHWVQAFVIRRRDRKCVGRSERFFVVIE